MWTARSMRSSFGVVSCSLTLPHRAGGVTIPSTVADEKRTNPFMRVHHAAVAAYTQVRQVGITHVLHESKAAYPLVCVQHDEYYHCCL